VKSGGRGDRSKEERKQYNKAMGTEEVKSGGDNKDRVQK
jgi:hypothetical protein